MSAKSPQPVLSPIATPRVRRTQGIALVVVLLSTMILMVSLLTITSTMAISSQRTTGDQKTTLQAQYAAEAGLALAKTRGAEAFALFPLIAVPTNTPMSTLEAAARDFCGKSSLNSINRATLSGPQLACEANGSSSTSAKSRNYTIFVNYIASSDVATAVSTANADAKTPSSNRDVDSTYLNSYASLTATSAKTAFWRDIFSGGTDRDSVTLPSPGTGVTASYIPDYGFVPDHVDAIPGGFRLFFKPVPVKSTATLAANGTTVSTRTLTAEPTVPIFSVDIARQCFCQYNYFANRRVLPDTLGGNKLVFGADEKFYGKVHVNANSTDNGAAYFAPNSSTAYPHFYGGFTTTAPDRNWWTTNYDSSISKEAMFHGNFRFNAESVVMPENAASQKWAVIGGNPDSTTAVSDGDLAAAYGKTTLNFPNGVYYGNGEQKGSTWKGGVYIRGNVSDLRLTTSNTNPKKQVITVTQIPIPPGAVTTANPSGAPGTAGISQVTTTTFTQNTNGSWTMTEKVGSAAATTTNITNGSFNGLVYVDGNIGSSATQVGATDPNTRGGLGGEGTGDTTVERKLVDGVDVNGSRASETPDVAADMQVTIAARDDIYIKRNLTYTNDPKDDDPNTSVDESSYNMLGIYSEKGNIKVDGVSNKPIKVDATLMAVGTKPNEKLSTGDDGKGFGTIDFGSVIRSSSGPRPKIELTGGVIEEQSQGVGRNSGGKSYGYDRDFDYDQRFANGRTPPYFPTQGQFSSACFEAVKPVGSSNTLPNISRPCSRNNEDVWTMKGV